MRWTRKPGEPIYLKRHMLLLAAAVIFPIVFLQLYKIYVGPIDFGLQLAVALIVSIASGLILYRTHRSSARNEP